MRFEYDEKTRTATYRENKTTIRLSSNFYDTDHLNYEYADEHVKFVFAAYEAREKRIVRIRGNAQEYPVAIAMYVVEQTVKMGAGIWPIASPMREARYSEIRRAVESGMFTLGTRGGKYLDWVPDYRVEFIPNFSSIPQLRL
jgi:hypothetical protein